MFYIPGEVLFVRVPRTASLAISDALTRKYVRPENDVFAGLHEHAFGRELRARLTEETYASCAPFMVVRNSWERLVSLYRWLRKHDMRNVKRRQVDWPYPKFGKWLLTNPASPYMNHALLQSTWHTDGVEIFRYEDLEEASNRYGISLEVTNNLSPCVWRDYYTSETKDLVYRVHKPDIMEFGFEF